MWLRNPRHSPHNKRGRDLHIATLMPDLKMQRTLISPVESFDSQWSRSIASNKLAEGVPISPWRGGTQPVCKGYPATEHLG